MLMCVYWSAELACIAVLYLTSVGGGDSEWSGLWSVKSPFTTFGVVRLEILL